MMPPLFTLPALPPDDPARLARLAEVEACWQRATTIQLRRLIRLPGGRDVIEARNLSLGQTFYIAPLPPDCETPVSEIVEPHPALIAMAAEIKTYAREAA